MRFQQKSECQKEGKEEFWKQYNEATTPIDKLMFAYKGIGTSASNSLKAKALEFFIAGYIKTIAEKLVSGTNLATKDLTCNMIGFATCNLIKYTLLYPFMTVATMRQAHTFPDYISEPEKLISLQK